VCRAGCRDSEQNRWAAPRCLTVDGGDAVDRQRDDSRPKDIVGNSETVASRDQGLETGNQVKSTEKSTENQLSGKRKLAGNIAHPRTAFDTALVSWHGASLL
jgi:hypothetical protein